MDMNRYNEVVRQIHSCADAAHTAASQAEVYKKNLEEALRSYEKRYGVNLGSADSLSAVRERLVAERDRLMNEAQKVSDRFEEIKRTDYAALEAQRAEEAKKATEVSGEVAQPETGVEDTGVIDLSMDAPVVQGLGSAGQAAQGVTQGATQGAAEPNSGADVMSALNNQRSVGVFPGLDGYDDTDDDEDGISFGGVEPKGEGAGIPQSAGKQSGGEIRFADLVGGVQLQSPYGNDTKQGVDVPAPAGNPSFDPFSEDL